MGYVQCWAPASSIERDVLGNGILDAFQLAFFRINSPRIQTMNAGVTAEDYTTAFQILFTV